jgi:acetylornithine deacetylase
VIDRDFLRATLARLVQINSINPTLAPGGAGEAEIARFVATELERCGLSTMRYEPEPGRPSVVGTLQGSGGGRSLMFNAHYDTVDVAGMSEPFSGAIRDGRLYGRGAYDMKGSLAAQMAAAKALAASAKKLRGDLLIAGVADEEYGSLGTAALVSEIRSGRLRVDAAIVTEPTALKICLAHKGYQWIEVATVGRAAHGSKFELGIDANMRMGRFLAELDKLEQELRRRPPHPLVGPPSLHAATLQGGSGLSTYAASCKVNIERRTIPGETESGVLAEVQALVDRLQRADPSFQATVRPFFARDAFEVPRDARIVRTVAGAVTSVLGRAPEYFGDTPWMDSALLAAAGVECVVIGPGGGGAHAAEEWVDVESVERLAEILARVAVEYCA